MAARSKTKHTIVATALALFNNEGESRVSSVDIASVIGISPGNLYYHYKGKDEIIAALFDDFEDELKMVLGSPVNAPLKMEDNWVYLYIIFEEIYDFRFFYRNQAEILERVPELKSRFSRLLALKERTANSLLSALEDDGFLIFEDGEKAALATRLSQHFTFWLQYHALRYTSAPQKKLIDQGVFMTLSMITPYWKDREGYAELLADFVKGR